MEKIFEIEELNELKIYLQSQEATTWRGMLFEKLLECVNYKNASDWNRAVRLCESLTILGWGEYEPVEAVRTKFYNGSPETLFINKFREPRFVNAIWSKRKDGYTMEQGRTWFHRSPHLPNISSSEHPVEEDIQNMKLENQRNWIPRNPILITRTISNCDEKSKGVIESVHNDFQTVLDQKMKPENYGKAINRIVFGCSYSYFDHDSSKANYVIADDSLKLKQKDFYSHLLTMFSKSEIEEKGYYLRNRYEYGNFRVNSGETSVNIYFEKSLGDLSSKEQKKAISTHIVEALDAIIQKLEKRKLDYDFKLMRSDFITILTDWKNTD